VTCMTGARLEIVLGCDMMLCSRGCFIEKEEQKLGVSTINVMGCAGAWSRVCRDPESMRNFLAMR
jgi:hypothetical protein